MLKVLAGLATGTLFGVGLTVSQMINPAKVIGFLDIAGQWDPTLAVVMIGALLATAPGFAIARRRVAPVLGGRFDAPVRDELDGRLIAGAVLFGIGWGISGFCPGPAISALGFGQQPVIAFFIAMVGGVLLYRVSPWGRLRLAPPATS